MAPFNGQPSRSQQVLLALAPKFTGFLSLLGSAYILHSVLFVTERERRHTYHRLLVGLSVADIVMTTGLFLSTWPMPVSTPSVAFAVGNTQTCAVVGFMEQAGVTAVWYNASLSVYYWLRIRRGWTSTQISKRAEPWLHAVPIVFGLATMTAAAALQLLNAGLWDCWIYPHPLGCVESWRRRDDERANCQRGDNASLYQWLFDVIPKWLAVSFVTAIMVAIHRSVWRQEQSSQRYSMRNGSTVTRTRSRLARALARQSYLYVGALYITYIPVIITRLTEVITGTVYYGMIVSIALAIPLQGFWNLLVFLRPRYLQSIKQQQQDQRRQSSSSGKLPFRLFVKAVSEAIQQGALDVEGDAHGDGHENDGEKNEKNLGDRNGTTQEGPQAMRAQSTHAKVSEERD